MWGGDRGGSCLYSGSESRNVGLCGAAVVAALAAAAEEEAAEDAPAGPRPAAAVDGVWCETPPGEDGGARPTLLLLAAAVFRRLATLVRLSLMLSLAPPGWNLASWRFLDLEYR